MPAVGKNPRARAATGGETIPFRPKNDDARRKNKAGEPFPKDPDGGDPNAVHEAEFALQIALANKVLHKHCNLLRMLANR